GIRDATVTGVQTCALPILASAFFFAFAAAQVPLGVALDRFGPKRCLLVCVAILVVGTVVFSTAATVNGLIGGRILIGLGAASFRSEERRVGKGWGCGCGEP